jgi:putative hydrolases of HD superfamily
VMANLMSGGGTWIEYNVTAEQLESRVGVKIARGAPRLWDWVKAKTKTYFV